MKRNVARLCLLLLPLLCGCTFGDVLFGIFGRNYSGGGTTKVEKQSHYDRTVNESRNRGTFGNSVREPWDE
ncbi:MAG: hypothetical protein WAO83_12705 [Fuerstiella sp.]